MAGTPGRRELGLRTAAESARRQDQDASSGVSDLGLWKMDLGNDVYQWLSEGEVYEFDSGNCCNGTFGICQICQYGMATLACRYMLVSCKGYFVQLHQQNYRHQDLEVVGRQRKPNRVDG
uniref:Uncharacterized protein n=1 Tax=Oryza punctata TaxID=4537 RepID=A0A0E0MAQ9_ORYPU